MSVVLLTRLAELEPYLSQVRAAADSARSAFGFLPKTAYEEFAVQGRMIVALDAASSRLLGYVLYGGAMPQGKIFQTWTDELSRGMGIGRQLVSEVVERLERAHYLSLRADVAQDLVDANEFYGALGFEVVAVRPGRTPGRKINIRVRELATPSLLELAAEQAEECISLPLLVSANDRIPLYVLDLNVLFDVARARPKAGYSGNVLGAGFDNDIRLAVSQELVKELERHTQKGAPDPILNFASALPRLPMPPQAVQDPLTSELAPIIFPDRAAASRLSAQDKSDLLHIATAVHESAAGFITSEKAILRAADVIRSKYGLEVVSPEAFGWNSDGSLAAAEPVNVSASGSGFLANLYCEQDHEELERFLNGLNIGASEIRTLLAAGTGRLPRRRHVVRVNGTVAGIAAWDAPRLTVSKIPIRVLVNEDCSAAAAASDYLIRKAITDVSGVSPCVLEFVSRSGQPSAREAAFRNGFFSHRRTRAQSQTLQKVVVGKAVEPQDWPSLVRSIRKRTGLILPRTMPNYGDAGQLLEIAGESGEPLALPLSVFERLFSVLLMLPQRPGVIWPITQRYAEELFSGSAQRPLLSGHEAAVRSIRSYLSSRGSYNVIPEGGIAVFYESGTGGGRMAATAMTRVTRKYLIDKGGSPAKLSQKAVMESHEVSRLGRGNQVVVAEFEDLMLFKYPVPLAQLRRIGCVDGSNLVTARRVPHEQILAIAQAGEPHA